MDNFTERTEPAGLYDSRFEHDNCGMGAVVDIKGRKSHRTLDDALQIVEHLEHRAGKDAEGKTGDGVGILLQIGHKFFVKAAAEAGIALGSAREYGVGMFFFHQEELLRNQAKKLFEIICKKEGLPFLGWREVPTCPEVLGHKARDCMPSIWQAFGNQSYYLFDFSSATLPAIAAVTVKPDSFPLQAENLSCMKHLSINVKHTRIENGKGTLSR